MARHSCKTLMVDDSDDDRALFRVAVQKACETLQMLAPVRDGELAIKYLSGENEYADRARHPYPELMVLDLKMPGKDGFDVLEWLSQQSKGPVVVVLSGSNHQRDMDRAFALGAHYYHVKPSELNEWITTARLIEGYMRADVRPRLEDSIRAFHLAHP